MSKVSVITPSFRGSEWLKLCIASVADQDVDHEHIVQDACSDDGTQDWLPQDSRVKAYIEKDKGMYDAVNRGLQKASGDILCYLNCDEQYLPGTLRKVCEWFEKNPAAEILFGDAIVVGNNGEYLCDRRVLKPGRYHTMVSNNLSIFTSSTFYRRSLIEKRKLLFNPDLKVIGDGEWILRLLEQGVSMGTWKGFLSVFTDTGENLSILPVALKERAELYQAAPAWAKWGKAFVLAFYRLRRLLNGAYSPQPHSYAIYTKVSPDRRQTFEVTKPTFRWIGR
ncbi:MAG: glycosyltransferase family 2 protein [Chthoniobacterales bacterium]